MSTGLNPIGQESPPSLAVYELPCCGPRSPGRGHLLQHCVPMTRGGGRRAFHVADFRNHPPGPGRGRGTREAGRLRSGRARCSEGGCSEGASSCGTSVPASSPVGRGDLDPERQFDALLETWTLQFRKVSCLKNRAGGRSRTKGKAQYISRRL